MILGVGTDLVCQDRIGRSWERFGERFAHRILTSSEWQRMQTSRRPVNVLAKCFAAKEAVAKALGTGLGQGVGWRQIELQRTSSGQPLVVLNGEALQRLRALGASRVLVSLSDERNYVLAFAVLAS